MVASEYKNILSFFIKDSALSNTKLSQIYCSNESNHKSVYDVYLRGKAMAQLINDPPRDEAFIKRFKTDCLKFLVELSNQIKKKLNFDENGLIAKLDILDPKKAQAPDISPVSLIPLAVNFPSIIAENE